MASSKGPIGGRWYSTLKEGLFKYIPRSEAGKLFIVQTFKETRDGEYTRKYAAFISSVDFYIFYYKLKEREHHEVILGEIPQKPRIDIDLEIKNVPDKYDLTELGNMIRDSVIESMLAVLTDLNTPLESLDNLIVCTSHSATKYSCHVILAGMMHYSCEEAKEFLNMIVRKSAEIDGLNLASVIDAGILDPGVYKSLQNFRLIGSGKRNASGQIERVKTYQQQITYRGSVISFPTVETAKEEMRLFRKASITDTTGCKHIPVIVPIKKKVISNVLLPGNAEADIMSMVDRFDQGAFEITSIEGSLIVLKRLRSSKCSICTQASREFCDTNGGTPEIRIHDNISPFVVVKENGDVLLFCRRAPRGKNFRNIGNVRGVQVTPPSAPHASLSDPESPQGTPIDIKELESDTSYEQSMSLDYIHNDSNIARGYHERMLEITPELKTKLEPSKPIFTKDSYYNISFSGKGYAPMLNRSFTQGHNIKFSSFSMGFK